VQDSYAEVAAAVSLGDAIQQGRAPSGITFANVQTQAFAAWTRLTTLYVPGQLSDYKSSVKAWADDVVTAAIRAQTGTQWQDVPYMPSPFHVDMTADQASTAFATSLWQIAILIQFGDRAVAVQDLAAMRYVGARLDAQSYWLEGIHTSADPNVVAAQLHFIEPVNAASAATSGWRAARRVCFRVHDPEGIVCLTPVRPGLGRMWYAAMNYTLACTAAGGKFNSACTIPIDQQWATSRDQLLPILIASGAHPEVGSPVPYRLQAFYNDCHSLGGTTGGTISATDRMPTTEGGWGCQINRCWTYLTYSGTEYKGGAPGCPEQGLSPRLFDPVEGIISRLRGSITPLFPGSRTWDGIYAIDPKPPQTCFGTTTPEGQDYIRSLLHQAMPGSGAVQVSGNNLMGVRTVPIDASDHAVYTYPQAAFGKLTVNYYFKRDDNGDAHVSGTVDVAATNSLAGGGFHCSIPFAGTRS
jgi:hypothetical protein